MCVCYPLQMRQRRDEVDDTGRKSARRSRGACGSSERGALRDEDNRCARLLSSMHQQWAVAERQARLEGPLPLGPKFESARICGTAGFVPCLLRFFFQAEDGIRDWSVTGVQTCALPI